MTIDKNKLIERAGFDLGLGRYPLVHSRDDLPAAVRQYMAEKGARGSGIFPAYQNGKAWSLGSMIGIDFRSLKMVKEKAATGKIPKVAYKEIRDRLMRAINMNINYGVKEGFVTEPVRNINPFFKAFKISL